jgi:hypothetical protein
MDRRLLDHFTDCSSYADEFIKPDLLAATLFFFNWSLKFILEGSLLNKVLPLIIRHYFCVESAEHALLALPTNKPTGRNLFVVKKDKTHENGLGAKNWTQELLTQICPVQLILSIGTCQPSV